MTELLRPSARCAELGAATLLIAGKSRSSSFTAMIAPLPSSSRSRTIPANDKIGVSREWSEAGAHWPAGKPAKDKASHSPSFLKPADTNPIQAFFRPRITDHSPCAEALVRQAKDLSKPVLASWMGGDDVDQGRRTLNAASISTFDYPDAAARAFALM